MASLQSGAPGECCLVPDERGGPASNQRQGRQGASLVPGDNEAQRPENAWNDRRPRLAPLGQPVELQRAKGRRGRRQQREPGRAGPHGRQHHWNSYDCACYSCDHILPDRRPADTTIVVKLALLVVGTRPHRHQEGDVPAKSSMQGSRGGPIWTPARKRSIDKNFVVDSGFRKPE